MQTLSFNLALYGYQYQFINFSVQMYPILYFSTT